jgi:hypothetical protein
MVLSAVALALARAAEKDNVADWVRVLLDEMSRSCRRPFHRSFKWHTNSINLASRPSTHERRLATTALRQQPDSFTVLCKKKLKD